MKICCLGDSLTEGDYGVFGKRCIANVHSENYPFFLSQLSGDEVKNFGRCGFTTTSYLKIMTEGKVDLSGADIIIIMLGTNGGLDPKNDTQGNADYLSIINICRSEAPQAEIVLCTPPHATENPEMSNCGYAPQAKNADEFTRKLAEKEHLHLIDLASCSDFCAENEHIMQPNDGLHFSKIGYQTMAKFIFDHLNELGLRS